MGNSQTRRTQFGAKAINSAVWPKFREGLPSMEGKTVAVTGCTSGTGYVLAVTVVELKGQLIMMNRPSKRHDAAFERLAAAATECGAPPPISIPCDLTSFAKVKAAGATLAEKCPQNGLDVLANNAGIMAFKDKATEDGVDVQMAANHLGHWILTSAAMSSLEKAGEMRGEARIINHSSMLRLSPDKKWGQSLERRFFEKNGGNLGGDKDRGMMIGPSWERYQQTKLANVVFTYALDDRLRAAKSKVKALVAHPGVALTSLAAKSPGVPLPQWVMNIGARLMFQSQEDGAMGLTLCSLKTGVESGQFYGPRAPKGSYKPRVHNKKEAHGEAVLMPEEVVADTASRDMLWEVSGLTTGVQIKIN